jgi:hypothetical protein
LYSALAGLYKKWLPGAEQQVTLKEAAYYSVMFRVQATKSCSVFERNPRCYANNMGDKFQIPEDD